MQEKPGKRHETWPGVMVEQLISKINEDDKDYKERKLELYYPDRLKKIKQLNSKRGRTKIRKSVVRNP